MNAFHTLAHLGFYIIVAIYGVALATSAFAPVIPERWLKR